MKNVWDKARQQVLTRRESGAGAEEQLDPGVNFFVLALESVGATTLSSCEGHPKDFYISFRAPYETAYMIKSWAGGFTVEIEREPDTWRLSLMAAEQVMRASFNAEWTEQLKRDCLRRVATSWNKALSKLPRP
jgi:hypothetical protein